MKLPLLIASLCSIATAGTAAADSVTTHLPVDHVYSVKGFDSNDDVQVLVSGHLPDQCHKAPRTKSWVFGNRIYVDVLGLRDSTPETGCGQMVVPFLEAVSIGSLPAGEYAIIVNGNTQARVLGSIRIADARSSAQDDYTYASVEFIEQTANSRTVVLHGYNPSDCYELAEVRFLSNQADTLAVLPIMRRVKKHCPIKIMPFSHEVTVPHLLDADRVLLHVRVLNGKSINALFDNSAP